MKARTKMIVERIAIERVLGDVSQSRAELDLYRQAEDETELRALIAHYRQRLHAHREELLRQADVYDAVRLMIDDGVSLFEIPDELAAFDIVVDIAEVMEIAGGRGGRRGGSLRTERRHSAEVDNGQNPGQEENTFRTHAE